MKTEKLNDVLRYVSPQIYTLPVTVDAGFAASAETDPMTEVDGEW